MTRAEFAVEFTRGLRFVLQKHEREMQARSVYFSVSPSGISSAQKSLEHATTMTDAAIDQFSDHIFDAIETLAQHGGVIVR